MIRVWLYDLMGNRVSEGYAFNERTAAFARLMCKSYGDACIAYCYSEYGSMVGEQWHNIPFNPRVRPEDSPFWLPTKFAPKELDLIRFLTGE